MAKLFDKVKNMMFGAEDYFDGANNGKRIIYDGKKSSNCEDSSF